MAEPVPRQTREPLALYALLVLVNVALLIGLASSPSLAPDYRAFHVAGQMARSAPATIYSREAQSEAQRNAFGGTQLIPFFHPPQELLVFAPLSILPFKLSLLLWRLLNVLFVVVAAVLLADALGLRRLPTILQAAALFPIAFCILQGQDSILLLVILCASFRLLRANLEVAAAVVLSLGLFKPQLPVIIALALLAIGRNKFVLAFAASSAAAVAASFAYLGPIGARQLIRCAQLSESMLPIERMPNIRGLLARFAGDFHLLTLLLAVVCLAAFFLLWRRARSLDFAFASSICIGSIVAPHLFSQDLSLLVVPIAIMARHWTRRETLMLAPLYIAPIFLLLSYLNLASLLVVPTVLLCVATFRLQPQRTPATAPQVAVAN